MYDRVIWPEKYEPKTSAICALNDIDVKAPPQVVSKAMDVPRRIEIAPDRLPYIGISRGKNPASTGTPGNCMDSSDVWIRDLLRTPSPRSPTRCCPAITTQPSRRRPK
jgi:hypothetical protein